MMIVMFEVEQVWYEFVCVMRAKKEKRKSFQIFWKNVQVYVCGTWQTASLTHSTVHFVYFWIAAKTGENFEIINSPPKN